MSRSAEAHGTRSDVREWHLLAASFTQLSVKWRASIDEACIVVKRPTRLCHVQAIRDRRNAHRTPDWRLQLETCKEHRFLFAPERLSVVHVEAGPRTDMVFISAQTERSLQCDCCAR